MTMCCCAFCLFVDDGRINEYTRLNVWVEYDSTRLCYWFAMAAACAFDVDVDVAMLLFNGNRCFLNTVAIDAF